MLLQVIGVMDLQGGSLGNQNLDDLVVLPLETGRRRVVGQEGFSSVSVLVDDPKIVPKVEGSIDAVLRRTRHVVDFRIHNMSAMIRTAKETQDSLTLFLASIAGLALLVGGIGIMNVMLMSALERKREIGIRLAFGAREKDIRLLFTMEAFVLAGIGGVLGCLSGVVCASVLKHFGNPGHLTASACFIAVLFAALTGLLFGYWPARQAAKRLPIEVLAR